MVYASASKGFRAGGAQANFPGCSLRRLPVDDITHLQVRHALDLRARHQDAAAEHVLISAAAYDIEWSNLQQQVALPCGFYLQVNGEQGAHQRRGDRGERPARPRAAVPPRARLRDTPTSPTRATSRCWRSASGRAAGIAHQRRAGLHRLRRRRLHPRAHRRHGWLRVRRLQLHGQQHLAAGRRRSARRRRGRATALVNLRFGVDHGLDELSLNFHNLFNAKPNLGDIGYVGYAQFNRRAAVIPQVATLQPLTATLQYTKSF